MDNVTAHSESSAHPEAMISAECWNLELQFCTRSGQVNVRTFWRITSGLDSRAIG